MAYTDIAALARNETFQDRIQVAVMKAAINVSSETAASQPSYEAYARRAALAANILNVPGAHRESWAWAVAAGGIVTADSPDGDIEWTINGLFDHMAGVIEQPPETA